MGIRLTDAHHEKRGNDMNEEQRITLMEEDLKILKNEVKTILLDIREQYLNIQNPFNASTISNMPPAGANPEQVDRQPEAPVAALEKPQDVQANPPSGEQPETGSPAGKPMDLSTRVEADMPGLPGLPVMMDDLPGIAPSADPGSDAGIMDSEDEEEDEPVQRLKMPRNKKKEADEESDERDEFLRRPAPKNGRKRSNYLLSGTRADLVVIAGLTQWIDQATGKLGKDRAEALVEMSTAMGRIPENIKDVLIRMVRISRYESAHTQSPTATDYLAILAQLESLMGGEQIQDNALLSVLSMMKESNRG